MTNLEQEMADAMDGHRDPAMENVILGPTDPFAKAAAKVALKWMELAYTQGRSDQPNGWFYPENNFDKFCKDHRLIPPTPNIETVSPTY